MQAVKDVPQRDIHEVSGDVIPINMVKGIGHLRDPRLNKVRSSMDSDTTRPGGILLLRF